MFYVYVIEGCQYCNKTLELIKTNRIKHKIIKVETYEKEKYKKLNNMNTFPQIIYKTSELKKDSKLIGGNDDFTKFIESLNTIKNTKISNTEINNILKYYRKI